jgi:cytochrome c biogenesis protein CcmG, thiol:disulfide interchange protein DsbE
MMQKRRMDLPGSGRRGVHVRALWVIGLLVCAAAHAGDAPAVGQPAPVLVVPQLDGHVFDLKALRGHVVIVNFWATWCAPCRAEMPRLDAFYRRYHAQGLELLGMSVDDKADTAAVQKIMKSFSYPAALASDAKVNGFGAPVAVPLTWIIDARGAIRVRWLAGNAVTEATLAQQVVPLLQPAQGGSHP